MATQEQFQVMLALMQHKMDRLDALQQDNNVLRRQNSQYGDSKMKRPQQTLDRGSVNDSEWSLFLDTWRRYKVMAALSEADTICMELRAARSTEVNKLLFEFVGPAVLDTATKDQLLSQSL